jgi:hypothetical protein
MEPNNLQARYDYLVGIAERDEKELNTLQQKQLDREVEQEQFAAWKEAKENATAEEKKALEASYNDAFLEGQALANARQQRKAALAAERNDTREQTMSWNAAKRSADRENNRQELIALKNTLKARQVTKENEHANQCKEKEQLRVHREERDAWVSAKETYQTQEANDVRKQLMEQAKLSKLNQDKTTQQERKKLEAQEQRKQAQAKYEMLQVSNSHNREETRKRLADRNAERAKRIRLKQEEKKEELKRKKEEREIARAEQKVINERKLKEIATKSRRLRTKNELTMKAKRDAALLETRRRRQELQKSREAAKMDQVSMQKHKNKAIQSTASRLQGMEAKIQATRKKVQAERLKMLSRKHGSKKAALVAQAQSPAGKDDLSLLVVVGRCLSLFVVVCRCLSLFVVAVRHPTPMPSDTIHSFSLCFSPSHTQPKQNPENTFVLAIKYVQKKQIRCKTHHNVHANTNLFQHRILNLFKDVNIC